MNDLGNTVIENFNTFPPSNTWLDWIKILAMPIATVVVGFLVFLYTNSHHKRTMLNSLDSKSEWRKKLFEIAGKRNIRMDDVYQLRAALRFDSKNVNDESLSKFDKVNIIMIEYCKKLTNEDDVKKMVNYKQLNLQDKEIVRLFCRYLLADHWEKNHDRKHIFTDKNKEKELCNYTLNEFNLLFKNDKESSDDFESNFEKAKTNLNINNKPSTP